MTAAASVREWFDAEGWRLEPDELTGELRERGTIDDDTLIGYLEEAADRRRRATNGPQPDEDPEPAPPAVPGVFERDIRLVQQLRDAGFTIHTPGPHETVVTVQTPAGETLHVLPEDYAALARGERPPRRHPKTGVIVEPMPPDRASDPQPGRLLVPRRLDQVEMRSVEWFEKPLWQRSAFELLAGPKGSGKGTYTAGLGARFSRSGYDVLYISTEDSTAIDLKPRLVAADADLERCFDVTEHVHLPDDVERLRTLATGLDRLGLLVIDPVANHIGDRNSNNDAEVRDAIAPLNRLADELDCLIIGIRHPGKDRSRGALASILGSIAWVDTPRAVVMIAVDDEDPLLRHIQCVAGNRSLSGHAQAFRIEAVDVPGLTEPITRAVELGESSKDVETLLASTFTDSGRPAPERDAAADIILRELRDAPRQLDYLKAVCAAETGSKGDTVYRAANALKAKGLVRSRNSGPGTPWLWSLTMASEEL